MPGGNVRLVGQVSQDFGSPQSNIEIVIFSDGTLTEADIRSRAIGDQATAGHDLINGTQFADTILAGTGNDTILGNGGADSLSGGYGDDLSQEAPRRIRFLEMPGTTPSPRFDGADLIFGGTGLDSVSAGAGDDTIQGCFGSDTVIGEAGNDIVSGEDGNDSSSRGAMGPTVSSLVSVTTRSLAGRGTTPSSATPAATALLVASVRTATSMPLVTVTM